MERKYVHTKGYFYETQVYIVVMKPAIKPPFVFLSFLQNAPSSCCHVKQYQTVMSSVTSCLSLPAPVYKSGDAVSKRNTKLSPHPTQSTFNATTKSFLVDFELICVKNNPPEAFSSGVRLSEANTIRVRK